MKIWVDDVRPAPKGYVWCKSVQEAKDTVLMLELYATVNENYKVELIDLDHDAGEFGPPDYIKILDLFRLLCKNELFLEMNLTN